MPVHFQVICCREKFLRNPIWRDWRGMNQKLSFAAFSSRQAPADRGDRAAPKHPAQGWVSHWLQHSLLVPWLHTSLFLQCHKSQPAQHRDQCNQTPGGICSLGCSADVQQCRQCTEQQVTKRYLKQSLITRALSSGMWKGTTAATRMWWVLVCKSCNRLSAAQTGPACSPEWGKLLVAVEFAQR